MNKISSFNQDLLYLETFAESLERAIAANRRFVEGSLVVSLNAPFGSGKSTFLEMWRNRLATTKTHQFGKVCFVNSWETDYFGDPLFAIISCFLQTLDKHGEAGKKLRDAARQLGATTGEASIQVIQKVTGVNIKNLEKAYTGAKTDLRSDILSITNAFSKFESRKLALQRIRKELNRLILDSNNSVLFLIDELDRCRPDYAIDYLEVIKHLFDIRGAVFVLATDRRSLENAARTVFGQNLDFNEYYRKFVHREINLPPINKSGYTQLIKKALDDVFPGNSSRPDGSPRRPVDLAQDCEVLCEAFQVTPRHIQEILRTLDDVFFFELDHDKAFRAIIVAAGVLMSVLRIKNVTLYGALAHGDAELDDVRQVLQVLSTREQYRWWMLLVITGRGCNASEVATFDWAKRHGLTDEKDRDSLALWSYGYFQNQWSGMRLYNIHKMIERHAPQ